MYGMHHFEFYVYLINIKSSDLWTLGVFLLQEGGPKLDSCLTLKNELSQEAHVLAKQEILLGEGTWVESSRVREPKRTALSHGLQSQVLWWWISFCVVLSQTFWLRVLPGGAGLVQPRWMPERRILGGGRTGGVSFWRFPNSSGWWRFPVPYQDLLSQNNSCKWLLWCLARMGSFNQCASSNNSPLRDFILKIILGNWDRCLFLL